MTCIGCPQLTAIIQALEDAQISTADVHSVEVVGGSSRVPALLRIIRDFYGKEPGRTLNAKECVSRGAALNCAMLSPIFRSAMPGSASQFWGIQQHILSLTGISKAMTCAEGSVFYAWWSSLDSKGDAVTMCRVRDYEVIDSYPFGVEFTWEKDGAPHTETLFKRAGPIPSSKMLTFYRYRPLIQTPIAHSSVWHTLTLWAQLPWQYSHWSELLS